MLLTIVVNVMLPVQSFDWIVTNSVVFEQYILLVITSLI